MNATDGIGYPISEESFNRYGSFREDTNRTQQQRPQSQMYSTSVTDQFEDEFVHQFPIVEKIQEVMWVRFGSHSIGMDLMKFKVAEKVEEATKETFSDFDEGYLNSISQNTLTFA